MLLWVFFALMTAAVVATLIRAINRAPRSAAGPRDLDVAVYRDQLVEIENDLARGIVSPTEAESARIEVSRRLLAAANRTSADTPAHPAPLSTEGAYLVAAAVTGLALVIYLALGAPWLEGQPYQLRIAQKLAADTRITDLVAAVERRLRDHPEDGRGWDVIAPIYVRQNRYTDAAAAFERAIRILGATPARLSGFAQATILANDGLVTESARKAYEQVLDLAPGTPEPSFWIAVAKEQDGQHEAAANDLRKLLATAPPDAPWRTMVEDRLRSLQPKLPGIEQTSPRSLSKTDLEAASRMPASERNAMVRQMVTGLAERLKQDGRDVEGWKRLLRSYLVLGERTKAIETLAAARQALAGDKAGIANIEAFARELGLQS